MSLHTGGIFFSISLPAIAYNIMNGDQFWVLCLTDVYVGSTYHGICYESRRTGSRLV